MTFQVDSQWRFFNDPSKSGWLITFSVGADHIKSAVIYNNAIEISYINPNGKFGVAYFGLWQGYENLAHLRTSMLVRVRDDNDSSGSSYIDLDLHTEKGGKLKGNGKDNVLVGSLGNDKIIGKAGDDVLHGDNITKTVWVGGNDVLLAGSGNDTAYGYRGNDTLYGGSGKDTLNGGYGHDELFGGTGNDKLFGGDGADIFVLRDPFQHQDTASDVVHDFEIGLDKLRVQKEWIDKGWVKIAMVSQGPDAFNMAVTVQSHLTDAELNYLVQHGTLPEGAKISLPTTTVLKGFSASDLDGITEGFGVIDNDHIMLDVV